tara:strand:- start:240 stop:689 length:450 start_codon:yes stop_codon:yes gene_type:complete
MNISILRKGLKKYIEFVPYYLIGSGFAFTADLTVFTILRSSIGTNISALIAYIFGTITSFSILLLITKYRLNKKRLGLLIHLMIGAGTLLINLIVLNIIDYISESINYKLYINILNKSPYYALLTKMIASSIGFSWTSFMTGKFLFRKR